jgi:hypothetical protein
MHGQCEVFQVQIASEVSPKQSADGTRATFARPGGMAALEVPIPPFRCPGPPLRQFEALGTHGVLDLIRELREAEAAASTSDPKQLRNS